MSWLVGALRGAKPLVTVFGPQQPDRQRNVKKINVNFKAYWSRALTPAIPVRRSRTSLSRACRESHLNDDCILSNDTYRDTKIVRVLC